MREISRIARLPVETSGEVRYAVLFSAECFARSCACRAGPGRSASARKSCSNSVAAGVLAAVKESHCHSWLLQIGLSMGMASIDTNNLSDIDTSTITVSGLAAALERADGVILNGTVAWVPLTRSLVWTANLVLRMRCALRDGDWKKVRLFGTLCMWRNGTWCAGGEYFAGVDCFPWTEVGARCGR